MRRRWIVAGGLLIVAGGCVAWVVFDRRAQLAGASEVVRRGRVPEAVTAPSPLDLVWPRVVFDAPPPPPASRAAGRVLEVIEGVQRSQRSTRYQHHTRVNERRGEYFWDCSGMTAWVLERGAPRARRALGGSRPVARTFARTIARAPTERARRGWRRIEHIRDARPGDVFAWERPPDFPSRNTGHVGFVMNRPVRVRDGLWAVPILDSTRYAHESDVRGPAGGTGRGTMTFVTDGAGHATGYGWHGTESVYFIRTDVVFGRVEG